jgi:biopolymer transport protein ExbD
MMVSLQLDRTQNIKVNLPAASMARADFKPDMINIAVDKEGRVWLEKTNLTLAALGAALSNRFRVDTNLPVYINGDAATRHGDMCDVLETVRHAGVQRVAFMVDGQTNTDTP